MSLPSTAQIAFAMDAQTSAFEADVLNGLAQPVKTLPSRWLYDDIGSALFEQITALPEYYPTRTETAILKEHAASLAAFCGQQSIIVEYGAGAIVKTGILLDALQEPCLYIPVDIAGDFLAQSSQQLRSSFQRLDILPIAADFTQHFPMPTELPEGLQRVGVFLGSTIGNLNKDEAVKFLNMARQHAQSRTGAFPGKALIGIDLVKSIDILLPAYDDAAGITAAFNLNLLTRINRELDGTFDLSGFRHEARWNETESAIEMHIVSETNQRVSVGRKEFTFAKGESIQTESSRKYTLEQFADIARRGGWEIAGSWTDRDHLFAVAGLVEAK